MYDITSTAHRVAYDLRNHPSTVRFEFENIYDAADDEYPAEVAVMFDNGNGMTIFDRENDSIKVQCSNNHGIIAVENITQDPDVDYAVTYASMLDRVVELARLTAIAR